MIKLLTFSISQSKADFYLLNKISYLNQFVYLLNFNPVWFPKAWLGADQGFLGLRKNHTQPTWSASLVFTSFCYKHKIIIYWSCFPYRPPGGGRVLPDYNAAVVRSLKGGNRRPAAATAGVRLSRTQSREDSNDVMSTNSHHKQQQQEEEEEETQVSAV